ncbi:MAG: FtsX-like permease family protein [Clostridiales bacterium]|nr:FtsX-like permease family protein [Clostridiales bacterium]
MKIRPFSALSYIRSNMARSMVLLLMMSFITVCFIGGMYVDNPLETFRRSKPESTRYIYIDRKGNSYEAIQEYQKMQEELKDQLPENANTILYINTRYCNFDSIMLFNCQMEGFVFKNEEDFEIFKERTHLFPEEIKLHDREFLMSEQLANNEGLKIGDPIKKDSLLILAQTYDGEGMRLCGIVENIGTNGMLVLSNDGVCDDKLAEDLERTMAELSRKYPFVDFETGRSYVAEVEEQMGFMYYIFAAVIVLVAIVLLVTINAAFTAAYDKRKHEFAIYKALGFTKGQIFRKIASEVLILNAGALILGAIMNAGVILVMNQIMWKDGYHFYGPSKAAVYGTLSAEVVVICTIILLNWRKVRKCEVTEE